MNRLSPTSVRSLDSLNLPKRILCADDDEAWRHLLKIILHRAGYEVTTAEDGLHAWAELSDHDFDLLITDFDMPGLNGLELAARTHELYPGMPMVMASSSAEALRQARHPLSSFAGSLEKPFPTATLLSVVGEALQLSSPTVRRVVPA